MSDNKNRIVPDVSAFSQISENVRQSYYKTQGETPYLDVLSQVQQLVTRLLQSAHRSNETDADISKLSEGALKRYIETAITDNNITCDMVGDVAELTNYIYHDMQGYSFISREKLFDDDSFEELNIDAWNNIWIKKSGGQYYKTDYSFLNEEHGTTILLRMFQETNTSFDLGMPYAVADLGGGVRITAYRHPIVDKEIGIASSIRKVTGATITREQLTKETITEEMLDFLLLAATHGVSQCFAGETGSGKTTSTGYILGEISKTRRIFTIEEGAREWDFTHLDDDGFVTNSVIHTRTRSHGDKEKHINQNALLQGALRFDPDIIGVGEMRSDEAFAAIEASNTGHPVVTTVHSSSAIDSPVRLMTLAKKAYEFEDHTLMQMITDAFPLQVYQRTLSDGSRRVTEIVEILGYKNGELQYKTLFDFKMINNIRDEKSGDIIEVQGEFRHINPISEKLHQRMLLKGATIEELEPYFSVPKTTET